jgi:hypothetical protein
LVGATLIVGNRELKTTSSFKGGEETFGGNFTQRSFVKLTE